MKILIRVVVVALLGATTAVLVSCGSTGAGLIPAANAEPLQNDFEAVEQAAESGNGNCAQTESELGKTEEDFLKLPATVDKGLHARLEQGIKNLHVRALEMCVEPTPTATTQTTTSTSTTPPPTKTSTTNTTTTSTTPGTTTSTTNTSSTPATTTPNPSGGTEAGGEAGGEQGAGAGQEGGGNAGANVGGASPGGGQ